MKFFADKICLVTGAASGIGKALAEQLSSGGAIVVLADRNEALVHTVAEQINGTGGRAAAATLDVTDRQAFAGLAKETVARHGRIDFLFNNAGIGVGGEARDFGPGEWDDVINVNLFGTIHGIQAVYPIMIQQGAGHIVNVASLAGLIPLAGEISYTTSKYAVVGLTHALRAEAADLGVNVTVICPGKIETPIYDTSPVIGFDKDKALALWPRGITPEACAAQILRGVKKNRATVVVTRLARFLWLMQRISPALSIRLGRVYMRRMRAFRISPTDH